jgi:hypothetical protein
MFLFLLIFATLLFPFHADAASLNRWIEMGPDGIFTARAVTADPKCPDINLGTPASPAISPMTLRSPSKGKGDVLVCEKTIPLGTTAVIIDGASLSVPNGMPHKIVIMGDTGCRLKEGDKPQDCNDITRWPFAKIIESAAAWKPDLVIHVGDYHYREEECPEGDLGCKGSVFGDNWKSWNQDFFSPASPLLSAAPWLFIRGNHETCDRAGNGWFRYLDPRPLPASCADRTPPYIIPLGGLTLFVLDSSNADDDAAKAVADYRAQLQSFPTVEHAWLLTHRPFWGFEPKNQNNQVLIKPRNATLQAAVQGKMPQGLVQVFSGHIHLVEWLTFKDGLPMQMIAGNGGAELVPPDPIELNGRTIAGRTVSGSVSAADFGYLTLDLNGDLVTIKARRINGSIIATCKPTGNYTCSF